MSLLYIINMNCREATYLREKKKEGKLSTTEKIALGIHLFFCRICALFFKQMDDVEKCLHHSHTKANNALSDEAKLKVQRALDNEMQ